MSKKTKGTGMSEKWFFTRGDGNVVELRARFEADDGAVGDAFAQIRPGEEALGLSHQQLFDAVAGVVVVENEKARIV
jgi:hypothetical protein